MTKRFQIIHLGNPYDFVVKDLQTNNTYGTFQGDEKQMERLLNELNTENQQCKKYNAKLYSSIMNNERYWLKQLKQLHQTLDDMIETERTELGKSVLKQFREAIQ